MVDRRSPGSMPHTAANPATGSDGEPPQQERNSRGYRFGLVVRLAVATVVDHWCPCPLVNRAPSHHRAQWEPNMGGIWEHRSDLNRVVPRRTARYGTGATCWFSVSGGRGLARAALGVKWSRIGLVCPTAGTRSARHLWALPRPAEPLSNTFLAIPCGVIRNPLFDCWTFPMHLEGTVSP